jgi:hypothetical protein
MVIEAVDPAEPQAVLTAAVIAGTVALIGAIITAGVSLRNEAKRREDTRRAEELKALRDRAAQVFRQLFVIQHEMEWITWHAVHHPESVNLEMVRNYQTAIHAAYPKVLGGMALVAAIDEELHQYLKIQLDQVYNLDSRVAIAALLVPDQTAIAALRELNAPAKEVYEELPKRMAEAMRSAELRTRPKS